MSTDNVSNFAVIFDVDGVLINSLESSRQITKNVLAEYGVDFDKLVDPSGGNHHGSSGRTILKSVRDQFAIDINEKEFLSKRVPMVAKELKESGITADPDLLKLLDDLKIHNVPLAVASSGIREVVDVRLEVLGIDKYFNEIVTASDVETHKPSPEPYLTAARGLGVEPTKCVSIEDSFVGIQAAIAAGMKSVAFTKHNRAHRDYSHLATSLIVDDWQKLNYKILKDLFTQEYMA